MLPGAVVAVVVVGLDVRAELDSVACDGVGACGPMVGVLDKMIDSRVEPAPERFVVGVEVVIGAVLVESGSGVDQASILLVDAKAFVAGHGCCWVVPCRVGWGGDWESGASLALEPAHEVEGHVGGFCVFKWPT